MPDLSNVSYADLAAEMARRAAAEQLATAQSIAAIYAPSRAIFEGQSDTLAGFSASLKAAAAGWPPGRLSVCADVVARQIDALQAVWASDFAPQLAIVDAAPEA